MQPSNYSSLFYASITSSSQVLLVCLTGYLSAKYGVITPSIQKGLSGLIINVLTPCLLFSNIAPIIDSDTLFRQLWVIPMVYFVFLIISATLGFIGGNLLKLSPRNIRFVATGIMFNNATSLTLGLLRGMSDTDAIKILSFGENDTTSNIVKRGTSYILLASLFSNLLRWSLGAYLLKKGKIDIESSISSNIPKFDEISKNVVSITETTPLIKCDEGSSSQSFLHPIIHFFKSVHKCMNAPLYSACGAIIFGSIVPLKSIFFGEDAPLVIIPRSMDYIGSITVPLTLITLGAQLKNLPRSDGKEMFSAITFIMSCRFIIMPTIGLVMIFFTRTWYMNDPVLWFVLILIASGPTAVNCMNLAQLCGVFQEEMATLLFYSYVAVAPLITPLIMITLSIISTISPK
ncbi:hypothetical protein Glove_505g16 [Diversispora epigaea]|uniref:Auxin efflux carrier n=1 Tax=Diversispora epigaea TaxID=1348612 RepID=A0A397GK49_9GLOM|nr:hypothetical protein Glove_505g16 [Diversispora epigaea]